MDAKTPEERAKTFWLKTKLTLTDWRMSLEDQDKIIDAVAAALDEILQERDQMANESIEAYEKLEAEAAALREKVADLEAIAGDLLRKPDDMYTAARVEGLREGQQSAVRLLKWLEDYLSSNEMDEANRIAALERGKGE